MGCVSSKAMKKKAKHEILMGNGGDHVVYLTSTTYGALNHVHEDEISKDTIQSPLQAEETKKHVQVQVQVQVHVQGKVEVINTWELMSDLEEQTPSPVIHSRINTTPFKSLDIASPKGLGVALHTNTNNKLGGKENRYSPQTQNQFYSTPKGHGRVFKPWKFSTNSNDKLRKGPSLDSPRNSVSSSSSRRRRSLGPLFDPDLIYSFERELFLEEEHIKKMVSPPGGEHCVVIYTTTLRGIRKTFEDCNAVRSVIESYNVRLIERDISMDSGFKEELRKLMGTKDVKVPLVFVKGRLIGGANQVVKLDEEGRLQGMLQGIPKTVFRTCLACGGIRFVMCMDCNGSCKVLDHHQNTMVRCGECNENGLIHCPLCSSSSSSSSSSTSN